DPRLEQRPAVQSDSPRIPGLAQFFSWRDLNDTKELRIVVAILLENRELEDRQSGAAFRTGADGKMVANRPGCSTNPGRLYHSIQTHQSLPGSVSLRFPAERRSGI